MIGGCSMPEMQTITKLPFTHSIQNHIYSDLRQIINRFSPVTLDEIQDYALQDRVDTKYLIRLMDLPALLKALYDSYSILEVETYKINGYRTLYLDTPVLSFYHDHHNGKRPRYKIRMREYLSSGQVFFEIKKKENEFRTIKNRVEISRIREYLTPTMRDFLSEYYPGEARNLQPALWNTFDRITLVNNNTFERLTVDSGLSFFNNTNTLQLSHLAVLELKQSDFSRASTIIQTLKLKGYQPISFSKYCTGIATLRTDVKRNRFKKNFLEFQASTKRTYDHVSFIPVHA